MPSCTVEHESCHQQQGSGIVAGFWSRFWPLDTVCRSLVLPVGWSPSPFLLCPHHPFTWRGAVWYHRTRALTSDPRPHFPCSLSSIGTGHVVIFQWLILSDLKNSLCILRTSPACSVHSPWDSPAVRGVGKAFSQSVIDFFFSDGVLMIRSC